MLAEESTNGEIYLAAGVGPLSSYTISTGSILQVISGRSFSFATSRNTTGDLTSQTTQGSLRGYRAAKPTSSAVVEVYTVSPSTLSSSWTTRNRSSASSGITEHSHTFQGTQASASQPSSTVRNAMILANTTSKIASILATPSAGNESFSPTLGLLWSRESVHTKFQLSMLSNAYNDSARVSTSCDSAPVLGNGSFITRSSAEWAPISSTSQISAAVTSVPGPNGNITTSQREFRSSQIASRANFAASIAAATEHQDLLATTASAKATTTLTTSLTSGLTGTRTTVGSWPATITFCSLSDSVPIVGVGYVTTLADGKSSITNTIPSQSLISASTGPGCAGEAVIFNNGLATTVPLSILPSVTTFPQDEAQVETQSGTVVQYVPETLSGYNNAQPIKISTNFVEVINGHTTTQGGPYFSE